MSNRKIILYPKSAMKPIILTDESDDDIEVIKDKVKEALKSNNISILDTSNDCLIIRPSEIQGVLITKTKNQESPKKDEAKSESDYDKLDLDKKTW